MLKEVTLCILREIQMSRWERINDENDVEITQRLKVFGGWVILTTRYFKQGFSTCCERTQCSITQCFVPDPNHEWEVKNENN
jgi:hypothetical protein